MSILNHFKHFNLSQGQENALTKLEAFLASQSKVFLLKGYAGTGKTTILKGLVDFLEAEKRFSQVIAPTGKAAKVLKEKQLQATTVHRGIYNFDKLTTLETENDDVAEKSFHFYFPIAENSNTNRVIIVDEASLISNQKTNHELFTFGSGQLLNDILTYSKINTTTNKIIFVGDPAQLQPVSDSKSWALEFDFFKDLGLMVEEYELTEIFRQLENNLILKNSKSLRDLLAINNRKELKFEYNEDEFIKIDADFGPQTYCNLFPVPKIGNGVIIVYSNQLALSNNIAIREKLFEDNPNVTENDLLIINNNIYGAYPIDLFNGDIIQVCAVSVKVETLTAPVMVSEGGSKIKKNISLSFRDIKIKAPNYDDIISCKIIDSFLNSNQAHISVNELKALYINFVIRFNEIQKARKNNGEPYFREGSEEFKMALQKDPYFNAIRVKYAYSITCHKAQGSEWDCALVDFRGRIGLNDDCIRWSYTSITRSKKVCYAINPPYFDVFVKLRFENFIKISVLPENAIAYPELPATKYHSKNAHPSKKMKYYEMCEKFENTAYEMVDLESREWQEDYFLKHGEEIIRLQGIHKKSGVFSDFKLLSPSTLVAKEALNITNSYNKYELILNYLPTTDTAIALYNRINDAISNMDLIILNIVEEISKYFINYYFEANSQFGQIQFFFNKSGQLTYAQPKVLNAEVFPELCELITKMQENAS